MFTSWTSPLKFHIQSHILLSFHIFLYLPLLCFRDGLSLNTYQQSLICLWKIPTTLLNTVAFLLCSPLFLFLAQNKAGNSDSPMMLWAPQNPGLRVFHRRLCGPWAEQQAQISTHAQQTLVTSPTTVCDTDKVGGARVSSQRKAQ